MCRRRTDGNSIYAWTGWAEHRLEETLRLNVGVSSFSGRNASDRIGVQRSDTGHSRAGESSCIGIRRGLGKNQTRSGEERVLTELELIERSRAGEQRAFRELYDANVDRIYRLAYRMAGEEDLARDFTQEAFVKAYEKLDQFRGDSSFSTWLHAIAVSVSLNGLRRVRRHRERERTFEEAPALALVARPADPDIKTRLKEAIDGLPELYRTVFLMHDLEGYTHHEIASTLDVAEGTSKARLSRARAKLRDSLGDFAQEYA